MKRHLILIFISTLITGCISTKSFVDPAYPKISNNLILKRAEPLRLKLTSQFLRNGEPLKSADPTLRFAVENVLNSTGAIKPVELNSKGEIKVVVNNITDKASAAAKGFGTGLTFGLVGSTVVDAYEMSIFISIDNKEIKRLNINHQIYTTIGNASLPQGVTDVPPEMAFQIVVEQMILRGLQDMQRTGDLSWNTQFLVQGQLITSS